MMRRSCRQCRQEFEITQDDLDLLETISPTYNGKKELIPPPTLCPLCRQRRRWAFQNRRMLYKRPSHATGKLIISAYSEEKPFPVVEREHWLTVDNTELGQPFDFSRPFFDQFHELFQKTTKAATVQTGEMVNSEFTHFGGWLKNCYMVCDAGKCEDCYYCTFMGYSKDCMDLLDCLRSERCFECDGLTDCYHVLFGKLCKNCSFSAYLYDCIGCKHCIGCANLRNKEYYVWNEFVGKERFEALWKELFAGSFERQEAMQAEWDAFLLTQPHRNLNVMNCIDCSGDYVFDCERARACYKCSESQDIAHCQYVFLSSDHCADVSSFGENMHFCYELSASGGMLGKTEIGNCAFSSFIFYGGYNVFYSINCHDMCKDCFGCADLRGKQYCILNTQYTKEEYEALVPRIIAHMRHDGGGAMNPSEASGSWGEFFPVRMSPFGYNETAGQEYLPMTREEALTNGFLWKETGEDIPDVPKILSAEELPDCIQDVPDDIVHGAIRCKATGRPFRIIAQELEYYRQMGLPLPRFHPDERHRHRLQQRNKQTLYKRRCSKCSEEMLTTYASDQPEIVYCERCYKEEIY